MVSLLFSSRRRIRCTKRYVTPGSRGKAGVGRNGSSNSAAISGAGPVLSTTVLSPAAKGVDGEFPRSLSGINAGHYYILRMFARARCRYVRPQKLGVSLSSAGAGRSRQAFVMHSVAVHIRTFGRTQARVSTSDLPVFVMCTSDTSEPSIFD